jgi:iron(III) transport system permease protein
MTAVTGAPIGRGRSIGLPRPSRKVIGWAVTLVIGYLLLAPVAMLLFTSFRDTRTKLPFESTDFTFANYRTVFGSTETWTILGRTLLYAGCSVGIAILIVIPLSFILERTNFPFRRLLTAVVLAPLGLPGFVAAMAWILLAQKQIGVINTAFRGLFGRSGQGPLDIYTFGGMVFVTALIFVPSIYLMVSGTFSRFDPALEESSAASGARIGTTLRRVTLPLLAPAILGATIFYFIVGIEAFEVPAFIGTPAGIYTLSTWMYALVHPPTSGLPSYGVTGAFGMLTILIAIALVAAYRRVLRDRSRFVTVGSRGFRPQPMHLSPTVRRLSLGVLGLYGLLAFALPFLVLVWRSFTGPFTTLDFASFRQLTLENYTYVIHDPTIRSATIHTIYIATSASLLTMALATAVAWFALRDGGRGARGSELLLFLSLGIPAVIVAISVGLVYLWLPVPVYGTIWVLVIALSTRFLPYGSTVMGPALMQIGRDLEDASATCGAPLWRTLVKVVFPIVWPSFIRGFIWTFVHAARDVAIVLTLLTVGNLTLGSELYAIWFQDAQFSKAAALSVLLAVASSLLTYVVIRLDPVMKQARS